MHRPEVRWAQLSARQQAVQPRQDLQEDGEEAMNPNRGWREILERKIREAPEVVPELPKPKRLPRPAAKPATGQGRALTQSEQIMYKRITGTSPRPGMTREEFNQVIARYRRGGGMS